VAPHAGSDRISIGMRGDGTSPRFYKEVTVREHKEEVRRGPG